MMANPEHGFVGFEYLEVSAKRSMESMYVDGYRNFGWEFEGASAQSKAELTRLQRQFEACALEIEALERSKTTAAAIAAFTIGLAGSAFLGGVVFAYLNGLLPLMVILAVPGFLGWIAPYFCYQKIQRRRAEQTAPIIEQKNDEIYSVCEQGCRLLTA